MKKLKIIFLLSFSSLFVISINGQTKNINKEKSSIEWLGKKIGGQHSGNIKIKSGTLVFKDDNIKSGFFTMDMNSITCTDLEDETYNNKLIGHLKSDDFFGVKNHPESSFTITQVSPFKNSKAMIKGDITVKGISEEIIFYVQKSDNYFTAEIDIDRSKHDVRYGSNSFFDNLGNAAIDDIFKLKIKLITND